MINSVAAVWEDLERDGKEKPFPAARLYRALGDSAIGIRAGYLPNQNIFELLIEVPCGWSGDSVIPAWRGMGHEVVPLGLPPRKEAHHLRLFLEYPEHKDIFLLICEDLVAELEGVSEAGQRALRIETCLSRWKYFFERSGLEGLSIEMQQGLFAELKWLHRLLEAGVHPFKALAAWKGSERGYHDFDLEGHVVEVKSTKTKAPQKVTINNERQLDSRGLKSLHLYVVSVREVESDGMTLPEKVESVQADLVQMPAALADFRRRLISAGYLDRNREQYNRRFFILSEDLYRVGDGFPRITVLPAGVGDLRYRIILSACQSFRNDLNAYLTTLMDI